MNNMESLYQIINASSGIINFLYIKIHKYYQNIFISINKIKYRLLIYSIEEDQNKMYMSGEIYQ